MTAEYGPDGKSGGQKAMEELSRISAYGHQLSDYLSGVGAEVEAYRFSIEKHGDELTIDVAVRASFHPKGKDTFA